MPDPPTTLKEALVQKIREVMAERRWSQHEFARQLGVTQGAVSYLLNAKRHANEFDHLEQLARTLGVPLSRLIADLERRVHGTVSVPPDDGISPQRFAFETGVLLARVEVAIAQFKRSLDEAK